MAVKLLHMRMANVCYHSRKYYAQNKGELGNQDMKKEADYRLFF